MTVQEVVYMIQISPIYTHINLKNSLVIHEENTKRNHCRVGSFICDKKSCSLTCFSFDFLGLDNVYF
jgi:hypothetical protein